MCVVCVAVCAVPAVNEVWHWIVNTERCSVQISADLHVISRHQTNGRFVLFVKHLPLQRRTQQQHEIIYSRDTERENTQLRVDMEAERIFACLLTADTLFNTFRHSFLWFCLSETTNTVIRGDLLLWYYRNRNEGQSRIDLD